MQGFIPEPYPCFGFCTISRYSFLNATCLSAISPSSLTAVTTAGHPALFGVQVQKGEVKLIAYTSIPCSNISFADSVLSSPPDRSPMALILVVHIFKIHKGFLFQNPFCEDKFKFIKSTRFSKNIPNKICKSIMRTYHLHENMALLQFSWRRGSKDSRIQVFVF